MAKMMMATMMAGQNGDIQDGDNNSNCNHCDDNDGNRYCDEDDVNCGGNDDDYDDECTIDDGKDANDHCGHDRLMTMVDDPVHEAGDVLLLYVIFMYIYGLILRI